MPTHAEKRRVPYAPDQMYRLVADIERYPEFLPWTAGCRIRSRGPASDGAPGDEVIEADLIISFRVFRERFGSRVTLRPAERRIDVAYLDGPFRYLNNHWQFIELEDGTTEIDFFVDFEFKSPLLQRIIGVVFNEAMRRVVRAFEQRAETLYGTGGQA
jgi:coenzyme Q-binding protein COQ10